MSGSAAALAARCKNLQRGSFMVMLHELAHLPGHNHIQQPSECLLLALPGKWLIEAKNELEHGQYTDWVARELRFGSRKDGNREPDLRKAEMLMFLARNEVI